eukprot:scaffold15416_cov106-Isochrysis_galbana.AAC.3
MVDISEYPASPMHQAQGGAMRTRGSYRPEGRRGGLCALPRSERDMLDAWRDFMGVEADPDLVVGYITFVFDYAYLAARAQAAGCAPRLAHSGRIASWRVATFRPAAELSSSALGQNEMHTPGWVGRADLDVFHWVKTQYKLWA